MIKPTEDSLSLSLNNIDQQEQVRQRNIQRRRLKRENLKQNISSSDQLLRMVISNAPIVLFALDHAGNFIFSEGHGLDAIGVRSVDQSWDLHF